MRNSAIKHFIRITFALYCFVMLWLLFHRAHGAERSYNLIPLYTIRGYFDIFSRFDSYGGGLKLYAVINFGGNIFLFVPLGIFLPLLFTGERRFWVFALTVILLISAVEAVQYITYTGAMDIDDLFLNTFGACIGYLIWRRNWADLRGKPRN